MKKNRQLDFYTFKDSMALPVVLGIVGLILILRPDSASLLVGKILGWVLVAAGAAVGVSALQNRDSMVYRVLIALGCLWIGFWMLRNPLLFASGLCRIAGLLLVIRGWQDRKLGWNRTLSTVMVIGGAVLLFAMDSYRLVTLICGGVCLGLAVLLGIARYRRLPGGESDDPNIIDVEKL